LVGAGDGVGVGSSVGFESENTTPHCRLHTSAAIVISYAEQSVAQVS
jgi:hypothetical protein